jgi:hypothetical protein
MSFARSVCGSASIGSRLYVVGGFDGERAMDSVEVFDWYGAYRVFSVAQIGCYYVDVTFLCKSLAKLFVYMSLCTCI